MSVMLIAFLLHVQNTKSIFSYINDDLWIGDVEFMDVGILIAFWF